MSFVVIRITDQMITRTSIEYATRPDAEDFKALIEDSKDGVYLVVGSPTLQETAALTFQEKIRYLSRIGLLEGYEESFTARLDRERTEKPVGSEKSWLSEVDAGQEPEQTDQELFQQFKAEVCENPDLTDDFEMDWYSLSVGFWLARGVQLKRCHSLAVQARYEYRYWEEAESL